MHARSTSPSSLSSHIRGKRTAAGRKGARRHTRSHRKKLQKYPSQGSAHFFAVRTCTPGPGRSRGGRAVSVGRYAPRALCVPGGRQNRPRICAGLLRRRRRLSSSWGPFGRRLRSKRRKESCLGTDGAEKHGAARVGRDTRPPRGCRKEGRRAPPRSIGASTFAGAVMRGFDARAPPGHAS